MRTRSKLVTVLVVGTAVVLTGWGNSAQAANKIDKKLASILGKNVVEAAHPTAKDISMIDYKEAIPKEGRLVLNIKMKYYGKVSDTKYLADVKITIDNSSQPPKVLDVSYSDDNKIPASKSKLKNVESELTRKLPKTL